MSIQDWKEGFKSLVSFLGRGELFIISVIILVGFAGFGLGRLSKIESERPPVEVYNSFENLPAAAAVTTEEGSASLPSFPLTRNEDQFVASKNGTKYHFPWCPGAQQMKEENKIWFSTREEAERAGYTPAANCKGL